ncbi:unnamed protein product [Penicillium olsonii]|uniref:Lytic polysaccharide monooxygenase n=1 Tax=Penicillium olsonii TaxID=99116 RepID=A0A9W4MUK0_PENOL|nr:unnamed protein product [Penicillium olsonii]CAG8151000.1 unnamed protein product [Penicillium olsonii]
MMFKSNLLAALLGASMVNAHMIMSTPTPYGQDSLNNSPLEADGSDFPCKQRDGVYDAPSTETIIGIGESHALAFEGSATHGGGSCQISLTEDLKPSKSSTWKVIKSFEGGCPANVEGNLAAGAVDQTQFNFTIPDGISAGKYTLAWTWFNRIGNREMYMNCAPITVSGGSSKRSAEELEKRAASFPPMFVANVNGCTTKEGVDIRFPQPGDDVEYDGEASNLAAEGSEACTGTASFGGSGDTSSGSSSGSSSSSGSDSGSSSGSGSSGSSSGSSGSAASSVAPVAPSSTLAAVASVSSQPEVAGQVASSPSAPAPAPSSSSSSGSSYESGSESSSGASSDSSSGSGTLSGACNTEGEWNCVSGSSFQRCANGNWSASQQMAAGTECGAGQSSELTVTATRKARHISSMRFRKRHVGAHHV